MKPADKIKELVKNLRYKPSTEAHNRMLGNILKALDETKTPSSTEPNIWRIIMKSKITKLAAAAVIIIAVVLSITFLDKAVTPVYGISDLPKLFNEAFSMYFKGVIYNYNGDDVVERPFEYWIDIANAKMRKKHTGLITNGNKTISTELEDFFNGRELVLINHTDKTVKYEYASKFYRNYFLKQNFDTILEQTIDVIMEIGDFAYIGKETIKGIECEIWDGQYTHPLDQDVTIKITCWLDPMTGNLYRMKLWYKTSKEDFKLGMELTEAERNVEIHDAFFDFEKIPGYEYKNTKETATKAIVPYVSSLYSNNVGLTLYTSFKLENGSVILCWKCENNNAEETESIYSQIFGGEIPETAVSIIKLQGLTPNGLGPIYYGKHLASIRHENNFCVWSIYIPENDDYQHVYAYSAIQKINDKIIKDKWNSSLTFSAGLNIDNKEDFNRLVLGAMTELSEDGVIPEGVTYENVLSLSYNDN